MTTETKIASFEQAGWEFSQIKERMAEGNRTFAEMRTEIGALKDAQAGALKELGAANRSDNEKLAKEIKEDLAMMKKDIHTLQPKPIGWLKILGIIAALGIPTFTFGGVTIWNASRYPERGEFQALEQRFYELQLDRAQRIASAPTRFPSREEYDHLTDRLGKIERLRLPSSQVSRF